MKKTTLTEDAFDYQAFFDEKDFAPNQLAINQTAALQNNAAEESDGFLDLFLTTVKWAFLYLPGAAAIHFIMLGFTLLFLYRDWGFEMMLGTLGAYSVAAFMIMLGIGKLRDLKYLKVVGAVSLTSLLLTVLYSILTVFIPGDFFGFFAKITLPSTAMIGYFVKRNIDESEKAN